jgi:glutaminyl-tRNA synthetase
MRTSRGTLTEPGKNSPFRDRPVDENLDLFRRMKAGEFPNGARVLRAKIDMASGNINLRDPVLYRILKAPHRAPHHLVDLSELRFCPRAVRRDRGHHPFDLHLEFEDHRPLYDWFLANLPVPSKPHQYEFARLNLTYTVLSKRVLTTLVRDGHVKGWDDPRMPTLAERAAAACRRRDPRFRQAHRRREGQQRGRANVLDFSIREALNKTALRRMAVLRPLKVVIENYEGPGEELDAVNHPDNPEAGSRKIKFGRELYIERDDFMETRRRSSSGCRPAWRCGCATPISSPAARR